MGGVYNPTSFVGYLQFNDDYSGSSVEGRLQWSSEDGTLEIGMPSGIVTLQIGQEMLLRAKNTSGADIGDGKAVRISGAQGSRPTIELADADDPAKAGVVGLTTEPIEDNALGYINTFGFVRDIDTTAWEPGDRLYLANTPGELVNAPPTDTSRKVFVGIVVQKAGGGSIFCLPINILYLSELSGIVITNPQNGDVLTYESASGLWKNEPGA